LGWSFWTMGCVEKPLRINISVCFHQGLEALR
jgi:hypothetical protein